VSRDLPAQLGRPQRLCLRSTKRSRPHPGLPEASASDHRRPDGDVLSVSEELAERDRQSCADASGDFTLSAATSRSARLRAAGSNRSGNP
jgi:hypothetical protein